jgi:hypothetical protein
MAEPGWFCEHLGAGPGQAWMPPAGWADSMMCVVVDFPMPCLLAEL